MTSPQPEVERWEYCTAMAVGPHTPRGQIVMLLDDYGDRGWELVTSEQGWWIFKRRLPA
jgi:hypothetical protein